MADNRQPGSGFGVLLRSLRQLAGLSREQLAAASGIAARTIQDLERGVTRYPHKDTAELLATGLGLGGPARQAFAAAAGRNTPPAQVLAAAQQLAPGALAGTSGLGGPQAELIQAVLGSPYRGLAAFTEQDAGFFFGRDQAAAQVLDKMAAHTRAGRLLMISGVSGAGKSSLLRAGVLPRLATGGLAQLPGSQHWPCLLVTPGRTPLHQLAAPAAELAGTRLEPVLAGLRTDPAGFASLARQALCAAPAPPGRQAGAQRRLVVVADQFEQLFTQGADEAQRQAFITALYTAAAPGPGTGPAALVVVCVRADFEARCADYPQLAEAVQDRYLLTAMTGRQLRLAITEPARKAGAQVAGDLTEVLLAEMHTRRGAVIGAGMLPLLSHALDQAWRQRTGPGLTLADYERTGGLERAVAASAQRIYNQLTPAQQHLAQQVFTQLTATSPEGTDTAARLSRADLTSGRTPAQIQQIETVVAAFAAERLLTLAADTVEISHEVLLTAWPLLTDVWLAGTRADRITRTRLDNTASEWASHDCNRSYLYTGTLLRAAADTATRITADPARHPPLSPATRAFLRASHQAERKKWWLWRQGLPGTALAPTVLLTLVAFDIYAGARVFLILMGTLTLIAATGVRLRRRPARIHQELISKSHALRETDPALAQLLATAAKQIRIHAYLSARQLEPDAVDLLATTTLTCNPAGQASPETLTQEPPGGSTRRDCKNNGVTPVTGRTDVPPEEGTP